MNFLKIFFTSEDKIFETTSFKVFTKYKWIHWGSFRFKISWWFFWHSFRFIDYKK